MGICHPKEILVNFCMDALIRIKSTPSVDARWSVKMTETSTPSQFSLIIKRTDTSAGWDESLFLMIQNHQGERQRLEVGKSDTSEKTVSFVPYISFRLQPQRQFWRIPTNLFQTWKSLDLSPEMRAAVDTFRSQPGYHHILWTDETCVSFILKEFGERFARAYQVLIPGAYRADFWRYCILWKFGGVYSDAKTTLFRPLDEILRPDDELVLVRDLPRNCILNGFIACKAGHPLLRIILDMTLERIEQRSFGEDPLDITGPHLFARAFCKWKGLPEEQTNLELGTTPTMQFLARSACGKYIVNEEGERLMQKEYDTYYKTDVDVRMHYPQLWALRAVYYDKLPWDETKK